MTDRVEHAQFLENLNSSFRLLLEDGGSQELQLIEVSELKKMSRQEMFSVVFRAQSNEVLAQKTHRLDHDRLGDFEIFLVPIGRDEQGVSYEAVFNRMLRNSESSGAAS